MAGINKRQPEGYISDKEKILLRQGGKFGKEVRGKNEMRWDKIKYSRRLNLDRELEIHFERGKGGRMRVDHHAKRQESVRSESRVTNR